MTQKLLFTVTNVLFYFLYAILCPEHTIPLKQWSITDFAIVVKDGIFWLSTVTSPQLICDVMRTWGTGIVTSYSSIVRARTNWRKDDLHLWMTTDFWPSGIRGLACKNIGYPSEPDLKRNVIEPWHPYPHDLFPNRQIFWAIAQKIFKRIGKLKNVLRANTIWLDLSLRCS